MNELVASNMFAGRLNQQMGYMKCNIECPAAAN